MTKKKINIILIIAVLGLWGTVAFRTINHYFGKIIIVENTEKQGTKNISLKKIDKDTFELEKIIRDPFLNKQFQNEMSVRSTIPSYHPPIKKTISALPPKPKPHSIINWPELKYYGYLKSKDEELVLLMVNSKLRKVKLNELIDGVVVKKKYKDSIEVTFNSETKFIRLK